jgi:hypothetical protein
MDKKDFFGPFFEKKVRFFIKKLFYEKRLPRGFEITNVISVKEDGERIGLISLT